jgi:4-hydroxy-tetrahydrodipicolinate reductase
LLGSGKNVVSLTTIPLVWPRAWGDEVFDRISAACEQGQSSFRVQGIAPGLYSDALILLLSGISEQLDGIRLEQILNYSSYAQPTRMRLLGFGARPDEFAPRADRIRTIYGPSMQILAATLGSGLASLQESISFRLTDRPVDIATGRIEAGTIGALRIVLDGSLESGAHIVFEIISRVADDLAPDWPHLNGREGFRIELAGWPQLRVELDIGAGAGNGIQITLNQAASLAVNSIASVCAATPGFHWFGDSPVTVGRHLGPAFTGATR